MAVSAGIQVSASTSSGQRQELLDIGRSTVAGSGSAVSVYHGQQLLNIWSLIVTVAVAVVSVCHGQQLLKIHPSLYVVL